MKQGLRNVIILSKKEIKSFLSDIVFIVFLIYAFSLHTINNTQSANIEARNISIAIVNEDKSQLSYNIIKALRKPFFKPAEYINFNEIEDSLDKGKYTFVLVFPEKFQANVMAQKPTNLQLNIDATVMGQAYIGSSYIRKIANDELNSFFNVNKIVKTPNYIEAVTRVKYNQNLVETWYMSIANIMIMVALMTIMLPAVALIREKETGTIEHLLVMPVKPREIMISKMLPNLIAILVCSIFSLLFVAQGYFGLNIGTAIFPLAFGIFIFQFSMSSLGMMLATSVRNTAQLSLVAFLVLMPMVLLSGAFTPIESMHPILQRAMFLSPLKYLMDFSFSVVFKRMGLLDLWQELLTMILFGGGLFIISAKKFKTWFSKI